MTTRLENAGLPFGEAHIPDIRANYHAVALTIINGERYILDQPQSEFIGQAIKEAPLYERAMYYGGAAVRFNRHFPDGMNTIMNAFDGDPFSAIIGTYEDEEFGDFGPYFDVTSRENKVKKDSQGGDIDVITAVKKNDPSVTIKIEVESGVDESSLSEENVINLESFKQGEEALVFTDNKLTPRLIKANKENLIREYGLTTREALIGMQQINEAAIKSSLEERKRQFYAYVTWDGESEINTKGSFSQYLDYIENIFPKSITKKIYYRGTKNAQKAFEEGDFSGFPSRGPLFGYPKGRFLDYPRGKYFTLDEDYALEYGPIVPAVLDIRNPYIDPSRGIADFPIEFIENVEGEDIVSPRYIKRYLPKYDAIMGQDLMQDLGVPPSFDPDEVVAVVFNSKQVHILGSKKDIEGFSKYMSREGIDKDIEEGSTSRRKRQFKKIDEEDYNEIDRLYVENLKKDHAKAMSEGIEALNAFRRQAVKTHRQVYGSLNAGPDFPFAEISTPSFLKEKLDSYGIEDIEKSGYLTDYTTESELTQVDEVKEREALAQLYYYSDFIEGDYLTENEKLFQDVYAQEGLRRRQNFYDSRGSLNYDNVVVKGDIILPIGISGSGKSTWIKKNKKDEECSENYQ